MEVVITGMFGLIARKCQMHSLNNYISDADLLLQKILFKSDNKTLNEIETEIIHFVLNKCA